MKTIILDSSNIGGHYNRGQVFNQAKNTTITLDGKLADIRGRLNDYATISPQDNPDMKVEFAWGTVSRILGNGGNFRS